jgi:hypothetical protein
MRFHAGFKCHLDDPSLLPRGDFIVARRFQRIRRQQPPNLCEVFNIMISAIASISFRRIIE